MSMGSCLSPCLRLIVFFYLQYLFIFLLFFYIIILFFSFYFDLYFDCCYLPLLAYDLHRNSWSSECCCCWISDFSKFLCYKQKAYFNSNLSHFFLTGNLGGTFGFFLGMSLITLLEFLDFTFRTILNLFKPKRNTRAITAENWVSECGLTQSWHCSCA